MALTSTRLPLPAPILEFLPQMESVDLVELFRSRAESVDARVHGPVARHLVPGVVTDILASTESRSFMAWDQLPVPGVTSALGTAGWERVDHLVSPEGRLAHQIGYARLALGVTGADAGLAESGSVVMSHGPGRPRMASLIPDTHLVILDSALITRTLSHWASKNPDSVRSTANLVVVTGPSRTGDIELQLNLGVHGPRNVHIVMFQ